MPGELGTAGTAFTAGGASAEEIGAFTGTEAIEPIRIFAGTASAEDVDERAELAVRDLDRAGGFDRSYLLVVTTTGSGRVVPDSVSAFEYLTAGDSAIVAIQYSYLPSWLSYAVDQERAREAGRELFDGGYEQWSAHYRPMTGRGCWCSGRVSDRSGERRRSAGSTTWPAGSMGRCSRGRRTSTPSTGNSPTIGTTCSPEIEPIFHNGRTIRFAARPPIAPAPAMALNPRSLPRTPSDPVVWWSPALLLTRPDWLEEPAGDDVLDAMVWIPFITFWQVTADLPTP